MEVAINYDQIKRLYGLFKKQGVTQEIKEDMVYAFTNKSEEVSIKNLSYNDANRMIQNLGGTPIQINRKYLQFDKKNPKHMNILSLCHQYGWTKYYKGKYVADLHLLGQWLQSKKAPINKPITDMKPFELNKTITALTNMVGKKWK